MTGRNLDPYIGRAFLGDGIATMVAGSGGGTGVTTYAENMGVMAVTKVYSSLVFVIAAFVALAMGFCPKFGALIGDGPAARSSAAWRSSCSASSPSPAAGSGSRTRSTSRSAGTSSRSPSRSPSAPAT